MTVAIPWLTGKAVDALSRHDRSELKILAAVIVAAVIVRLFLSAGRRVVAGRVSLAVEYDLRQFLFNRLQRLELGFFDEQQTGQLMSRATVDLQSVRFFLGYGLVFIVQSGLTIVIAAAAMFVQEPVLAALALSPMPFVVISAARYGRRSRPAMQEVQQRIAELTAEAEENIVAVRVVKAFAAEARQMLRFRHFVTRVFDQQMYTARLAAIYNPLLGFLPLLGLGVVLFVGGHLVIDHHISIGEFTAFYTYVLMLTSPLRQLGISLAMAQRASASGNRIFQILDREAKIIDSPGAADLPNGRGAVDYEAVTFSFTPQRPVIHDVSLSFAPSTSTVLAGPTGSGKSTLLLLLPRLYDTDSGAVKLDKHDVRSIQLKALRHSVGVVTDDPFLFSFSIADNIAYGRPSASREEIKAVAAIAQAHGFIEEIPNGYDAIIGERGLTLSAGQRQRIAIARALLIKPRVLVLDDATSALDPSTEHQFRQALKGFSQSSEHKTTPPTIISIAHRLAALQQADQIVVLSEGRVIAQGRHDDLMKTTQLYRDLLARARRDSRSAQDLAREAAEGL